MSNDKRTCPCCGRKRVGPIRTWRRLSAYYHEPSNLMTSCLHCIREDDVNLKYDWHEYYSGQGYGQTHVEFMKELADQRRANEYQS
jgi:hypothetical protein